MKAVLLCDAGANQRALASRLHSHVRLDHIGIISLPRSKRSARPLSRIALFTIGRPLRNAWRRMMGYYHQSFPSFPEVPSSHHRGVNAPSVLELIAANKPDLVLVSGTDLLREDLIDAIGKHGKTMNLHTGLSPYLKGGPNCTNWALALGEFDLIGNTIMWLDAGIDSGNLVATERTPLSGTESLTELHIKVMDHAHGLYSRALKRAAAGTRLPSVPQREIGEGRLLLNRHWTARHIAAAVFNYAAHYSPEAVRQQRPLVLVPLSDA